jgi:CheY-like chemotaxis protein
VSIILILDPDLQHASELTHALANLGCRTTTCASIDEARAFAERSTTPFDLNIIVLPSDCPKDWRAFASILNFDVATQLRSPVLCVSQVYRGPQARLEAERCGFHIAYERQI